MKEILLSFPNHSLISMELLSEISFELQGYLYLSQRHENDEDNTIHYYPKSLSLFFVNSFLPVVSVKEESDLSGVVMRLNGKMKKGPRFSLIFFYVLSVFMLCVFLLKMASGASLNTAFPLLLFVPCAAFMFVFSTAIMHWSMKTFAAKYRTKIEELISNAE